MMNWLLVAVVAGSASAGNALQTLGMKHHGEIHDFRPGPLGRAFLKVTRSWHVPVSIVLMAISFFAFLSLLSVADLSFAVPATAVEYALSTVAARYFLKEQVNWRRWTGAALVTCGVALLAL